MTTYELKPVLLSIAVSVLLIMAACGPTTPKDPVYKVGKEGITLKFLPGSPPLKVYEGDEFNANLYIENNGAFDVMKDLDESGNILSNEYAILSPTYDAFYLGLSSMDIRSRNIYLRGKSFYHPRGEGEIYEYGFRTNPLQGQREHPTTTLIFTLCYPYKTTLSKEVCVDKDFYNLDERRKVCTIKDLSFSQGQGAPIMISRVEPRALKLDQDTLMEFNIMIENAGGGNVITFSDDQELEEQCVAAKPDREEWNRVNIKAFLLGQELDCKTGMAKLLENKAEVRCRTTEAISGEARNFLSVLQVELSYLYQTSVSKSVEIVRN